MTAVTDIQILNPISKSKLGRFRGRVGVFVIRENNKVLFVGWAKDVYGSCCRYFYKDGPLQDYEIKRASFEVLLCNQHRAKKITKVLRNYLQPTHNTAYLPPMLNRNERIQRIRLLNQYRQDSFFETPIGDHQTDEQ